MVTCVASSKLQWLNSLVPLKLSRLELPYKMARGSSVAINSFFIYYPLSSRSLLSLVFVLCHL
jgi:hypothetical protein